MLLICYAKCTTCARARKWLDGKNIAYDVRDIKGEHPTFDELKKWYKASGLPLRRFFNTSGLAYRALGLKDRLAGMSKDEQLGLLASDGMLVKRPILVDGKTILIGFKEAEWLILIK
jgi:arsenate reductase